MPRENDLEGAQDEGGKHGGQAGMPKPQKSTVGKVVGDPNTRPDAGGDKGGGRRSTEKKAVRR